MMRKAVSDISIEINKFLKILSQGHLTQKHWGFLLKIYVFLNPTQIYSVKISENRDVSSLYILVLSTTSFEFTPSFNRSAQNPDFVKSTLLAPGTIHL